MTGKAIQVETLTKIKKLFLITVRVEGIGPSTSVLSGQRSTTELHTQNSFKTRLRQSHLYQKKLVLATFYQTKIPIGRLGFLSSVSLDS
ncbi:MAG: hypothetical protein RL641_174 [Candidatus Parcubacteria bacterium]